MTDSMSGGSQRALPHVQRALRLAGVTALGLVLANCGTSSPVSVGRYDSQQSREFGAFKDKKYGKASERVVADGAPVPKGGGRYQVGKPYRINGKVYRPYVKPDGFSQTGSASWYGAAFHGRKTANGEIYDRRSFTAAHPTMPLPSYARVTNLRNGYSIVVRVNDRGPYHGGRIIDLSERTAEALDYKSSGTARVKVHYLGKASLGGSDDRQLLASLRRDGSPASLDGSNVMIASAEEPAFTPVPAKRRVSAPRVASVDSGLPGVDDAQRVKVNTLSDAAPRDVGDENRVATAVEPALAEPARLPVSSKARRIAASEEAIAEALPVSDQTMSATTLMPVTDTQSIKSERPLKAAFEETVTVQSDGLSALYYAEPDVEMQPAAEWKLKTQSLQPLGEARLLQGGSFTIAAGVFRKVANAERLARRFDGETIATVTAVTVDGKPAFAVTIGPIPSERDAKELLGRVIGAGAAGAKLRRG